MNKFNLIKEHGNKIHYILFPILFLLCWKNIDDFGVSLDDEIYYLNGVNTYEYIKHFFLSFNNKDINLEEYRSQLKEWPIIFELVLVFICEILNINKIEKIYLISHQLNFIIFFISLFYFYKFINKRFKNSLLASLSVLFLVLSPRIFTESFYNSRDIFFMSLFIFFIHHCFCFVENKNYSNLLKLSFFSALLINAKVLGLIPFSMFCSLYAYNFLNTKKRFYENVNKIFFFIIFNCFFIYLFWPYLWNNPIINLYTAFRDILIYHENLIVLNFYFGEYIESTSTPWHYRIVWFLITTPLVILFLFFCGISLSLKKFLVIIKKSLATKYKIETKEFIDLFLFLVLISSLLTVIEFNNSKFGGWRHIYYLYPIIIYFSINFFDFILNKKSNNLKILIVLLITFNLTYNLSWIYKNHPNQYVYFNLVNKRYFMNNFDLDWWGISHKEAITYILDNDKNKKIKINGKGFTNLRDSVLYLAQDKKSRVILTNINEADYIIDNKMKRVRDYKKNENINFEDYYDIKVDGFIINKVLKKVN